MIYVVQLLPVEVMAKDIQRTSKLGEPGREVDNNALNRTVKLDIFRTFCYDTGRPRVEHYAEEYRH